MILFVYNSKLALICSPIRMNQTEKTIEKPLECPIPHKERKTFMTWVKKLGFWGFMFFLMKGLILYIFIPYLIAKGFIGK